MLDPSSYFRPQTLWSVSASTASGNNYITSTGAAGSPNERTIAFNALSNQLLVVKGPAALASLRIFVLDADTGTYLYDLNKSGITTSGTLTLVGIGVADDGAVYAASVAPNNNTTFKVYRWANTHPSTVPQLIWGTGSSGRNVQPDLRFGRRHQLPVWGRHGRARLRQQHRNHPDVPEQAQYVGVLHPVATGT